MASVARLSDEHSCCARCTARARYVRDVADLMGLRDWAVVVDHEPSEDGTLAQVRVAVERRELSMAFCGRFDELDPDDRRHAVTHELVHPHLRDIWSAVEVGAAEAFGGMAYRVYVGGVRRAVEQSVDALAAVIAPYLPESPE